MHSNRKPFNDNPLKHILGYERIDGVVPGVRGQRAFPTRAIRSLDPFVLLDHIGPEKLSDDFRVDGHKHPHRGFETITFMFEGNMAHVDSMGTEASLTSGSVQVMNAGRGIQHGGDMWADENTQRFNEIQLWVNSPAKFKMTEPHVKTLAPGDIPVIKQLNDSGDQVVLRVIAGNAFDLQGPATTFADISALHVAAEGAHEISLPVPVEHETVLLYVLEGMGTLVGNQRILPGNSAILSPNSQNLIELEVKDSQLLFLTGKPIGESIVMGGPFVMNTQEEIDQAMLDYRQGQF